MKIERFNNIFYYLGNSLILISILGFVYIFYPLLQIYFFPPQLKTSLPSNGTFLTISKINAQAQVIEQVDPWNETSYMSALKKGIAQAKGTSLPGQKGTIFLFAHSSGMPWDMTHANTIFLRLGELKAGDTIIIIRNGKSYLYKVREKKEVFPTEVSYLLQTKRNQLVLQTCTPIGTSYKRLLVFADPIRAVN